MKNKKEIKHKLLKPYSKPIITSIQIQIEDCISAGSARIIAPNRAGDLLHEWDIGEDRNESFNW